MRLIQNFELKRWIATYQENESIFVEVDISGWSQEEEGTH